MTSVVRGAARVNLESAPFRTASLTVLLLCAPRSPAAPRR